MRPTSRTSWRGLSMSFRSERRDLDLRRAEEAAGLSGLDGHAGRGQLPPPDRPPSRSPSAAGRRCRRTRAASHRPGSSAWFRPRPARTYAGRPDAPRGRTCPARPPPRRAAEAKTSSSGSGTEPVYGSAATSLARSSYSSSPRPRLMRQEKTEFTAATISGRERKLSRRNTRLGSPSSAGASAEALVLFKEDARLGEAEAVYALLDVADHEEPPPVHGDGADYLLLHARDVLILVDHDLGVPLSEAAREIRRRAVLAGQQPRGQMLGVREVEQGAAPFAADKLLVKFEATGPEARAWPGPSRERRAAAPRSARRSLARAFSSRPGRPCGGP